MTLKIELEVPFEVVQSDEASAYIGRALMAIGFERRPWVPSEVERAIMAKAGELSPVQQSVVNGTFAVRSATDAERAAVGIVGRERGKPGEGRARRTKEEIAEDAAADEADTKARAEAALAGAETPSISTGDERLGPEDSAEDAAQDAADEAAETLAESGGKLTIDDVRKAMGRLQKRIGMAAAVRAVPALIGKPEELAADKFENAILALDNYGGEPITTTESVFGDTPPAKTKADVVQAMLNYAGLADGHTDKAKPMPNAQADFPKIFAKATGDAKIDKISLIPEDKYGVVVQYLEAALQEDPFKRGAQ